MTTIALDVEEALFCDQINPVPRAGKWLLFLAFLDRILIQPGTKAFSHLVPIANLP